MQINCRVPFPERFMHRRRGWRDTPTLIQYEPDAPPGTQSCILQCLSANLRDHSHQGVWPCKPCWAPAQMTAVSADSTQSTMFDNFRQRYMAVVVAGSGPSLSEGSLATSQQDRLWVVDTLPLPWTLPVPTAAGPGRMLDKRSCCELEADACVQHVLNRREVRVLVCQELMSCK